MITVSTFSDLQGAILSGERFVDISGSIVEPGQNLAIGQSLGMGNKHMTHIRGGHLQCASVTIDGYRGVKISEMELYANVKVRNGIRFCLEDSYIAAAGELLRLETIAGTWLRGVHFNPLSSGSISVRVGDSVTGYECLDSSACLFEGGHTAFWFGGSGGNIVNIWSRGDKFDRQVSSAFTFKPMGSTNVRNVLIDQYWINGADYPIVINIEETTGRVDRFKVTPNGHCLGSHTHGIVTIFGDENRVSRDIQHPMYGPLEPG